MLTLDAFLSKAYKFTCVYNWRYGQAAFNHLRDVRPELAEAIRGTDKDPYYVANMDHGNHPNWERFIAYLKANW